MAISKEYKNAIARLNRANGVKSGQKGYITPSEALKYAKKYKDVKAVDKAAKRAKTDRELKPYIKEYNRYMGYKKGDAGYMTSAIARAEGIEKVKDYAVQAEIKYGEQIRQAERAKRQEAGKKAQHTRLSKQAAQDMEKIKPKAEKILKDIQKHEELSKNIEKSKNQKEYEKLKKQIETFEKNFSKDTIDFFKARKDLIDKYRKMAGLLPTGQNMHLNAMNINDVKAAAQEFLDKNNQTNLYEKYKSESDRKIISILSKIKDTYVEINGNKYNLSEITNISRINSKLFWNAYRTWEQDGGLLIPKGGVKNSDYLTLSSFFESSEGNKFLQSILNPELRGVPIAWDV